jgi:hypothetical protein
MSDSDETRVFLRADVGDTPLDVVGPLADCIVTAQSTAEPQEPDTQGLFDYIVWYRSGPDAYRYGRRLSQRTPLPCANGHDPEFVLYGSEECEPWVCASCHIAGLHP